jgi:gliding motility-associated-like protein
MITKITSNLRATLVTALLVFAAFSVRATHNRAGEITYRHISGNTYEFTVYTYTKTSAPADRPWLPIDWGDGSPADSLERIETNFFPDRDSQENIYIKRHTFPGAGEYDICITDPNRNGGILNIDGGNSLFVVFAIQTKLRISAAFAPNNSVVFTNIPLQDACKFQPWVHNPGAIDFDGDSLSFRLVPSMGAGCVPFELGFYEYPDEIDALGPSPNPMNTISIDQETGTIRWENPQRNGEYNIAFIVEEWRDGLRVGTVMRDMQILVTDCDNLPPEIIDIPDTCVEAGDFLAFEILATDPEGSNLTIEGFGLPFQSTNPAEINQLGQLPPVEAEFSWLTDCEDVRLDPYQVTFQVTDNGPGVPLVDVTTMNITVVAPAPENLEAEAVGSSINLNWDPSPCNQAIGYKIYRRINPFGFEPGPCETGVPEYTGYTLIDTTQGLNNTTYVDDSEVIFGRQNCYMVVACFPDGAESYASNETCAEIRFEIPIIKKNSIGTTSQTGTDTIRWRSPIELDTEVFPGPYQYRLLRSPGYGQAEDVVLETSVEADLADLDTTFISNSLNTADTAHTYRVELYSGGEFATRSNLASSLFLELTPNDNSVTLDWVEEVPWINFEYQVYRRAEGETDFVPIDTIADVGYVDTGLVNNVEYCYYIISRGSYFAIEENDTLINFSQQVCTRPFDRNPPCPPELAGEADCRELFVDLEWTNPNLECEDTDDVTGYNVYFAPTEDSEFELLQSFSSAFETELFLDLVERNFISGCYAVTALDSLSLWPDGNVVQNESEFSNVLCFDDCPEYILPNVFTPNGDGRNDLFVPFPVRAIDSVEFTVFNRWGGIVFQTTDPLIRWNGENTQSGEIVSDGTYFYTCRVFTKRLTGIEPIDLSGYITVFAERGNTLD